VTKPVDLHWYSLATNSVYVNTEVVQQCLYVPRSLVQSKYISCMILSCDLDHVLDSQTTLTLYNTTINSWYS